MAYSKTELGQQTFKDRSVPLTPRQRSAFILFDGRRSVAEVLAATSGLGVTAADIDHMLQMGLLAGTPGGSSSGSPSSSSGALSRPAPLEGGAPSRPAPLDLGVSRPIPLEAVPVPTAEAQRRYQRAYPIATRLTAAMGLRGFRLNLAVEGAGSYEQLLAVAPRIKEAVGAEKFRPLDAALRGED